MGCAFSSRGRRRVSGRDLRAPSFAEYAVSATPRKGLLGPGRAAGEVTADGRATPSSKVADQNKVQAAAAAAAARKGFSGDLGVIVGSMAAGASKATDVTSFLGRAGVVGLEKAVEVLDTLGSSVSSLSPSSGFTAGLNPRGNKVSILAFEVANTIAKGTNLMRSLSEENVQFLKKEVVPSEGVQRLVSSNTQEVLYILAADKKEELRMFSAEVARFGDLCKDPEWHNLTRYFQKLDSDLTSQEKLRGEAEATMEQLINLAHNTSELYHELHALDRFEQDYKRKLKEEESIPNSHRGEGLVFLMNELKHQRKLVKSLKKKSLWSRNMGEVVEKLVDVVVYLHKEISEAFGLTGVDLVNRISVGTQRLGVSGLALHYANVINQIENILSRPLSLPPNMRDTLYNGLPKGVKAALRFRLQSFQVNGELTVSHIKAEMQKILQWLAPMAENTIKAHQGFGWVGEWANMGTEVNKRPGGLHNNANRIQTLYHADKEKAEEYILQLVVWLHHLVEQVKNKGYGITSSKPLSYTPRKMSFSNPEAKAGTSPFCSPKTTVEFSDEEREMLDSLSSNRLVLVRSRSLGSITKNKTTFWRHCRSRSIGSASSPIKEFASHLELQFHRTKILDLIDGLETLEPLPTVSIYT